MDVKRSIEAPRIHVGRHRMEDVDQVFIERLRITRMTPDCTGKEAYAPERCETKYEQFASFTFKNVQIANLSLVFSCHEVDSCRFYSVYSRLPLLQAFRFFKFTGMMGMAVSVSIVSS